MQIGTILTFAGDDDSPKSSDGRFAGYGFDQSLATLEILGASLLDRTVAKLEQMGSLPPVILRDRSKTNQLLPSRSKSGGPAPTAWEESVARLVNGGVQVLCLAQVNGYCDLDYREFLRFHLRSGSAVTQAYASDRALNIALVDACRLREGVGSYRKALGSLFAGQCRFSYRGYLNRISTIADCYRLSHDGLAGECGLRPRGQEVSEGVWLAPGAQVHPTARVFGPSFVGSSSRLRPGCTVGPGASIESNCEIDCGSLVENSCVLQNTYVGMALDVRNSVVSGHKLFHIERNVEINLVDRRLVGSNAPPSLLAGLVRKYVSAPLSIGEA